MENKDPLKIRLITAFYFILIILLGIALAGMWCYYNYINPNINTSLNQNEIIEGILDGLGCNPSEYSDNNSVNSTLKEVSISATEKEQINNELKYVEYALVNTYDLTTNNFKYNTNILNDSKFKYSIVWYKMLNDSSINMNFITTKNINPETGIETVESISINKLIFTDYYKKTLGKELVETELTNMNNILINDMVYGNTSDNLSNIINLSLTNLYYDEVTNTYTMIISINSTKPGSMASSMSINYTKSNNTYTLNSIFVQK